MAIDGPVVPESLAGIELRFLSVPTPWIQLLLWYFNFVKRELGLGEEDPIVQLTDVAVYELGALR